MRRLIRLSKAEGDLDEIWRYIAQDNPDAAFRTVQRIADATGRLGLYPFSGPPLENTPYRTLSVPPYSIYYQVTDDAVLILRVLHHARNTRELDLAP